MLRFCKIQVAKEKLYSVKQPMKTWDVNINNITISKLAEIKNSSKYLMGYLDEVTMYKFRYCLKWVDILRHLKIKVEIRIGTISWCLRV